MPSVNIPNVGVVHFPENMSPEDIQNASQNLHTQTQGPQGIDTPQPPPQPATPNGAENEASAEPLAPSIHNLNLPGGAHSVAQNGLRIAKSLASLDNGKKAGFAVLMLKELGITPKHLSHYEGLYKAEKAGSGS